MSNVTTNPSIEDRKADHIRINLEENVQFPHLTTGLERYRFMHQALPELNLSEIDSTVTLFGKTLSAPIVISSMTGGTEIALRLNQRLAEAAQTHKIAMGLGSQRAGLRNPEVAYTYQVRASCAGYSAVWQPRRSSVELRLRRGRMPARRRYDRSRRADSAFQRFAGSRPAGRRYQFRRAAQAGRRRMRNAACPGDRQRSRLGLFGKERRAIWRMPGSPRLTLRDRAARRGAKSNITARRPLFMPASPPPSPTGASRPPTPCSTPSKARPVCL